MSYNAAFALFRGTVPMVAAWLVRHTGVAVLSFAVTLTMRETRTVEVND